MAWTDALRRKKKKQEAPPSVEVVNPGMIPKHTTVTVHHHAPPIHSGYIPEAPPKTKRGRPRSSNNYNAHIHIKCPQELARRFKVLSAMHGVHYAILLQQALDAFDFVQDDD